VLHHGDMRSRPTEGDGAEFEEKGGELGERHSDVRRFVIQMGSPTRFDEPEAIASGIGSRLGISCLSYLNLRGRRAFPSSEEIVRCCLSALRSVSHSQKPASKGVRFRTRVHIWDTFRCAQPRTLESIDSYLPTALFLRLYRCTMPSVRETLS
jgi:hypothetical protein